MKGAFELWSGRMCHVNYISDIFQKMEENNEHYYDSWPAPPVIDIGLRICEGRGHYLAYFPEVGLCDLRPVCVSVSPLPQSTFECLNQSL
jgi:hypothetical protein